MPVPAPKKIIHLDFTEIEIYEHFFISTAKEGITITQDLLQELIEFSNKCFPDREFGFIANRLNHYSVDPTGYLKTSKIPRFKGMAIVHHATFQKETALFEKQFYDKPFEVFHDLEKAKSWMHALMTEKTGVKYPRKSLRLDFVYLEFYDHYVVSTMKEEMVFTEKHRKILQNTIHTYYQNKKIGYIANRVHQYNVDPTVYLFAGNDQNIIGMAVVCHSELQKETALFEKSFYNKPFEIFDTMSAAQSWIQNLIKNK